MSANLDRFSVGFTPQTAVEMGICKACGDIIYDYESTKCNLCEESIHEECAAKCEVCDIKGCKSCLKDDWDGVLVCEECQLEKLISHVRNNFAVPGYWYSGLTRIDGKVTLEFISSGGPGIEVSFNRN